MELRRLSKDQASMDEAPTIDENRQLLQAQRLKNMQTGCDLSLSSAKTVMILRDFG